MEDSTTADTSAAARSVHVIESTFHFRDEGGRQATRVEVLVDEGWFEDLESAVVRRDQLNDQHRRLYTLEIDRARRAHEAKIDEAVTRNAEVMVLRNNGFDRPFVPVPDPFVATPFEQYRPDRSFTTYEVTQIHRSEFDGIALATKS